MNRFARLLIVMLAALALLIGSNAAIARSNSQPPLATADANCIPGSQPLLGMFRAYLPLIIGSSNGIPPAPVCVTEIEVNDTHTSAQVITAHCVWGSAATSGDPDWYSLGICSPVNLTVRLDGPGNADLDLYLYGDPPGVPIATSENPGSNEVLSTHLITGVYYSLVQPAMGSGAYTLTFEVAR